MLNPFRAVQGENWKKVELVDWSEKKYLAFFDVVNRFTMTKNGIATLVVNTEGLMKLEQDAFSGQFPFLHELVVRMNQLTTDPKATPHKFYDKFAAAIRQIGAYIKQHPALVTDKMKAVIEINPRLSWMLKHYEMKDTKPGIPIVVETKLDKVDSKPIVIKNSDMSLRMMESRLHLSDALYTLSASLTKKELRQMNTKEKVSAALGIMKALQASASMKPNIGKLNQIVINRASKDDLESAMLDFNRSKE